MGYTLDGTKPSERRITWRHTGEDFSGYNAARAALEGAGFSVGTMQRDNPMGLLFGEYAIAKWRNLSDADRDELHGFVRGDCRNGPMTAHLYTNVPRDAMAAFAEIAEAETRPRIGPV